jgi:hypothetical protein
MPPKVAGWARAPGAANARLSSSTMRILGSTRAPYSAFDPAS